TELREARRAAGSPDSESRPPDQSQLPATWTGRRRAGHACWIFLLARQFPIPTGDGERSTYDIRLAQSRLPSTMPGARERPLRARVAPCWFVRLPRRSRSDWSRERRADES